MDANYNIGPDYAPLPALLAFLGVSQLIDSDDVIAGSLACFREAGGEGPLGKRGQVHVMRNRSLEPGWWGRTFKECIFRNAVVPSSGKRFFQFSCFNEWDPNATRFPSLLSRNWLDIQAIVTAVLHDSDPDITDGSQYYHDSSIDFPVTWGQPTDFKLTLKVGRLIFYRYQPILSNRDQVQGAATGEA